MSGTPRVSIVTATYNRSNLLPLVLDAVCASTVTDWEHIIVGDACTDDTAAVIAARQDPRVRFVNLERNVGEQSGPNNAGLVLARGAYVAILNHDDLWMPWHLETALRAIELAGADMAVTLTLTINAAGDVRLAGVSPHDRFVSGTYAHASSWVCRRDLVERVGRWRPARTLHVAPSTDWIERAHRMRAEIVAVPAVTLVAILSGVRRNSYADRQLGEHARLSAALRDDPRALVTLLTAAALRLARNEQRLGALLIRAGKVAVAHVAAAIGGHPLGIWYALRYRRRGGFLDRLRQTRGLTPLPRGERDE
jgi:hypothetical protein